MLKIKKISKQMFLKISLILILIAIPLTVAYLSNGGKIDIGARSEKVVIESTLFCFSELDCIEQIVARASEDVLSTVLYNGHVRESGAFYGGKDNPDEKEERFRLNYNGPFYATNLTADYYVHQSSDINLKDNIDNLENSSEKIKLLNGVSFNWKNNNERSIGLIAQEVEEVFPEFVAGKEGSKTVAYSSLVVPLIEAFKEKDEIINDLEKRLNEVEEKLKNLGY